MEFIGLTNHIEIIVINQVGPFAFGRNQFDVANPEEIKTVKQMAGKFSIPLATYNPFIELETRLKSLDRNDSVSNLETIVFVHNQIDIEDCRFFELLQDLKLSKTVIGQWPYHLPSRSKVFR